MKMLNRLLMLTAAAVLCLSAGNLQAQEDNTGGGGGGNGRRNRGNWDPAQMQQRMMDNVRDQLGFTNDTEWTAVQPLVQKVFDARRDIGFPGMRAFARRNRGGEEENRRPGGMTPSPEAEALQNAIDGNAPAAQIKSLLEKYQASQKQKQDKLKQSQETLRKVLNQKQEAQATLLGLLE